MLFDMDLVLFENQRPSLNGARRGAVAAEPCARTLEKSVPHNRHSAALGLILRQPKGWGQGLGAWRQADFLRDRPDNRIQSNSSTLIAQDHDESSSGAGFNDLQTLNGL